MNVTVLNGSPRGKESFTYQNIRYLEKCLPEVSFTTFHIGHDIKKIEAQPDLFDEILEHVRSCSFLLWIYPVYTFLVPFQLVRFIELILERNGGGAFENKYCGQLSTSKHFFDVTAANYIRAVSEDLGMRYIGAHPADSEDLFTETGRTQLSVFMEELFYAVREKLPAGRKYPAGSRNGATEDGADEPAPPWNTGTPVTGASGAYPGITGAAGQDRGPRGLQDKRIVIVTDCGGEDRSLRNMLDTFKSVLPLSAEEINLRDFPFKGGCLGCFSCAFNGKCVYTDRFDDFHRRKIAGADAVINAATISHHWFRPVWKCYDDRQFYNGHRTSAEGTVVGYIISGALRQEPNLREILEARAEVGGQILADIVTDEDEPEKVTKMLRGLAERVMLGLQREVRRPANFYGTGGMKIFRDLIYTLKGLMQEDHRFYKKHGLYDFPQKKLLTIWKMRLAGLALKSPKARVKASRMMMQAIKKRYDKIVRSAGPHLH